MADDTGEQLINVAREILAKRGYLGLTMKTAAAAAGITPDVAMRYYRNRDALVAAALRLPSDPISAIPTLVAPGVEGMGERLVRYMLDILRDPQTREELVSLARTGVNAGHAMAGLQDFLERAIVDRMTAMIGVPDARMRSALITSYLLGVAMTRYGVRLEPLASASEEDVVRMVAPVIQDLLDPRKPLPGHGRTRSKAPGVAPVSRQAPPARATRTFDPDPKATAARAARTRAESGSARKPPAPPGGWPSPPPAAGSHADATALPKPAGSNPPATPTSGRTSTISESNGRSPAKPAPPKPAKAASRKTAPRKATPAKTAPRKATPAKATPAKATPAKATPAKTTARKASGARTQAARTPAAKGAGSAPAKAATRASRSSTAKKATRAAAASAAKSAPRPRPGTAGKPPKHAAPAPPRSGAPEQDDDA